MTQMVPDKRNALLWQGTGPVSDSVAAEDFRASMRKLACGVVVVTTLTDGRPWGVTLSSVSSFSADPARISLSVGKNTATAQFIVEQEKFGVAILSAEDEALARSLAAPGQPKFIPDEQLDRPSAELGVPVIAQALYNLECRVAYVVEAIDHLLVIADVITARIGAGATGVGPLTFYDSTFGSFTAAHSKGNLT
ncbi:flavin reductase family protein [Gordonia sp. NB41Y]|uniref:flavin reductase family protein n=1 Tax=Gordonia sp. NB41Y TaxID=875808 RepID=UPI00128F65BE|nr:flavin reductase family protein [Gordonia sp. NB41Y]WLP88877.1 flavin reductase family protein [Gordonia sp. NB41Y]